MKRIIIIIMIIVISLTIVIMPIRNPFGWDNRYIPLTDVSAESDPLLESMMIGNPAFNAWLLESLGWFGMQGQTLAKELDHINRNGDIDTFIEGCWNSWESGEVVATQGLIGTSIRMSTYAIKSIWDKVKEMSDGATDNTSDYYIDLDQLDTYVTDYQVSKLDVYANIDYTYINTYLGGIANFCVPYSYDGFVIGNDTWSRIVSDKQYIYKNSTLKYTFYLPSSNFMSDDHLIKPILTYRYSDGSTDIDGNKWKLQLFLYNIKIRQDGTIASTGGMKIEEYNITNDIINQADYPIQFDDNKIDEWANIDWDSDFNDSDYIEIEIPYTYIDEMANLQDRIANGQATISDLEDISTNIPRSETIETTNDLIRDLIDAVSVPNVANPDIEYPDITKYKLPTGITTKFPFSIPFDVYRAFQMLEATPEIPHWEIPIKVDNIVDETIVIDLEDYQGLINIVRWFLLAIFILGLILATRGLIKG